MSTARVARRASRVGGHGGAGCGGEDVLAGFAATIHLYRLKAKWELFREIGEAHRVTGLP